MNSINVKLCLLVNSLDDVLHNTLGLKGLQTVDCPKVRLLFTSLVELLPQIVQCFSWNCIIILRIA